MSVLDSSPLSQSKFPPTAGNPPGTFEWIVAIVAVIVQSGAFVSVPLMTRLSISPFIESDATNALNTYSIAASLVLFGVLSFSRLRELESLALGNLLSMLFLILVLTSTVWSIHPDVSIRRGVGYAVTLLIAMYIPARFELADGLKILSIGFAISAICSLLFVAAAPKYGIMHNWELAGDWRGVFAHKNQLGSVMGVAVFAQLFLLTLSATPRGRGVALLLLYLILAVLSHSATAVLMSAIYVVGAGAYWAWPNSRLSGPVVSLSLALVLTLIAVVVLYAPALVLGALGKDSTLTGRTSLWALVVHLIAQKPLLGWGYRAMWQQADAVTIHINDAVGWAVPGSHNAFLEIALQLGLIGVGLLILILITGLYRAARCSQLGIQPLGWFSMVFFGGIIAAGQTLETLGQNQVIEWFVFNMLLFYCGKALTRADYAFNRLPAHRS